MQDLARIEGDGLGQAVPFALGATAQKTPVVGTAIDNFDRRGLRPATGTMFATIGECVAGSDAARALDKYRINPGNVGTGKRRDEQFSMISDVAVQNQKPVRIGVNGGSLNQELVMAKMQENTDRNLGKESEEILNECMVLSAVESTALADLIDSLAVGGQQLFGGVAGTA
jgi:hypothetical protein